MTPLQLVKPAGLGACRVGRRKPRITGAFLKVSDGVWFHLMVD